MQLASTSITTVPKVMDTRIAMYGLGVDVGSDATVLAISGLKRLVWAKPHFSMIGIPGVAGNRMHSATTLEIRAFKKVKSGDARPDFLQWHFAVDVFAGGRLSIARLIGHRDLIDTHFGLGTTEQLRLGWTVVIGADEVGCYMASKKNEPAVISPEVAKLIASARIVTTFGEAL